ASYLFTIEGLGLLLGRLSPGGHAVLSVWVENPPRTGVRLASLILDALRNRGVEKPARHILALRSWSTATFYVGREPFDETAVERLKKFAEENSFDLVYFEGMSPGEANRFNVIPDVPYFGALRSLAGARSEAFRQRWPFRLDAPCDDRPFFSHHFRWRAVPAFVATLGGEWIPFVEWGYLLQVASMLVASVLGVGLLIVPCAATRAGPSPRTALLFFALGVAYMFVELWAIYRLIQWLGRPMLASA